MNHALQVNLVMYVYPGEASDGTADGSAIACYYRSVNQRLSKLGHTGHVLLLVGIFFAHQTYEVWDSKQTWSTQINQR